MRVSTTFKTKSVFNKQLRSCEYVPKIGLGLWLNDGQKKQQQPNKEINKQKSTTKQNHWSGYGGTSLKLLL